jgi:hypothetical protein
MSFTPRFTVENPITAALTRIERALLAAEADQSPGVVAAKGVA